MVVFVWKRRDTPTFHWDTPTFHWVTNKGRGSRFAHIWVVSLCNALYGFWTSPCCWEWVTSCRSWMVKPLVVHRISEGTLSSSLKNEQVSKKQAQSHQHHTFKPVLSESLLRDFSIKMFEDWKWDHAELPNQTSCAIFSGLSLKIAIHVSINFNSPQWFPFFMIEMMKLWEHFEKSRQFKLSEKNSPDSPFLKGRLLIPGPQVCI